MDQKTVTKAAVSGKSSKAPGFCVGNKRKRAAMSEEAVLVLTNMTNVVNNVVAALRETEPE